MTSEKSEQNLSDYEECEILLSEWRACRESIGLFDRTVTHLRTFATISTLILLVVAGLIEPIRGIIVELLVCGFLIVEFYLERHYRGYLLAAVKRAMKLEEKIKEKASVLRDLTIELDSQTTNGMLSEVITIQREKVYSFWMAEAHTLLYFFLLAGDSIMIIYALIHLRLPSYIVLNVGIIIFVIFLCAFLKIWGSWKKKRGKRMLND